jgi:hypothetical protein
MDELTAPLAALLDDPDAVQDPIAILHWGKSGSYLLCSLLDGHPQALQNPFDSMFGYFHREGQLFADRADGWVAADEATRWAAANCDSIIGDRRPAVEARAAFLFFLERILSRCANGVTRRYLFKAVHVAYAAARRKPLSTTRPFLIWNLHVLQASDVLLELYPDIRFVTTVRFPEKALDSELFTFCSQARNFDAPEIVRRSLADVFKRDTPILANHVGLRFEDMHCRPEATMRALAEWIGIDWASSLLASTIDGEEYYFSGQHVHTRPSADPRGVTGFSPERALDRSFSILSPVDRFLFRLVLARQYHAWGYGSDATVWPESLRGLILSLLAWRPLRAQTNMFASDLAAAARSRSKSAVTKVLRSYLAEVAPTAELLRRKGRSDAGVLSVLRPVGLGESGGDHGA